MSHTTIGHWLSFDRKIVAIICFMFVGVWTVGCGALQPSSANATASQLPPTPAPLATATIQPTTSSHGYRLPAWTRVELPQGCSFHELSADLRWILVRDCLSASDGSLTDRLAWLNDRGELMDLTSLAGKFTLIGDNTYTIGFTPDSSRLILWRNGVYRLVNLSDLIEVSYLSDTRGVSGVNDLGSERWSPDGRLYLTLDQGGMEDIAIASPSHGTEEILVKNRGRHGTQVNWCANDNEIVYVDGEVGENMRAQLIDLQSRQPRTLLESRFPSSVTGASCSPDGKWIAVREQQMASNEATLWLIERVTDSKSHIEYNLAGSPEAFSDAWRDLVWAPDGAMLALRGSSSDASDGFTVIGIPTGKIMFQEGKGRYLQPLAWSVDNTSLLVLGDQSSESSTYSSQYLEWITIRP